MTRELKRHIGLLLERIFHFAHVFGTVVLEPISIIAFEKEMRMKVRSRSSSHTQAQSIDIITGYDRTERAYVNLTRRLLGAGFHIVLGEQSQNPDDRLGTGSLQQLIYNMIHL